MARKYMGGDVMYHDGRHGWLRMVPEKVTSWDFRKLSQLPPKPPPTAADDSASGAAEGSASGAAEGGGGLT
jgi:hypothetical protein